MRLYNSLTRKKEVFIPLNKKAVKMYVCGITPYDTTHLGHAFTYVVFDVLYRYLKFTGYSVQYLQNITDLDDNILKKAKEQNKNWQTLGAFWTNRYLKDMDNLNILPPTIYKKATSSIDKMKEMISYYLRNNFAYVKDGTVYFKVNKFKNYGILSHYNRQQMLYFAKEWQEDNDSWIKDPLDFKLWQKAKKGEPSWASPWGQGMPGWHIECPALIAKHLGLNIDIHAGGRDLDYPHHENEIAEIESYTGLSPFSKYWLHTGMVMHEGEKMSKSLGNLVMVSDLLKKYSYQAIRYFLLSHFYRFTWEFNEDELILAKNIFIKYQKIITKAKNTAFSKQVSSSEFKVFENFMDDDLDTPKALNEFRKVLKKLSQGKNNLLPTLKLELKILGLDK